MGEGSARVLRGELMSDVIFSGSSTRKPVGTATVELVFDNTETKIGGEFAAYDEISVKRQVGRDGVSFYELNGSRCRRKDIKDLFLGTGLGSRSYSIIEQGMISRIVDARPEEIREHLEEAAGISKYKERRRETERRIKHTRENLDRLSDLREEVSKQIDRLKRQAQAAERYRKLKLQQRELQSKLLALQWRDQQRLAEQGKSGLQVQETAMQEGLAEQRASEARLEDLHQQQVEASEAFNQVQGELYSVASDIARLEQGMQHSREMQLQQQKEFEDVSLTLQDIEQHMMLDKTQVEHLTTSIAEAEPLLATAENSESSADQELTEAESQVQAWQESFEVHHRTSAQMNREADGLKARVEILDQKMSSASTRLEKLADETLSVKTQPLSDEIEKLNQKVAKAADQEESQQSAFAKAKEQLLEAKAERAKTRDSENELQLQLNSVKGRLEALRAIQNASSESQQGRDWLSKHELQDAPQLAAIIQTQKGWEEAVETVLGSWLNSMLVANPGSCAPHLDELKNTELSIIKDSHGGVRARSGTLAEKVTAPDAVIAMLNHVRVEKDLAAACEYLDVAADEESAITQAGEWVGPGWIRISRSESGQAGILAREKEIKQLGRQLTDLEAELKKVRKGLGNSNESIAAQNDALETSQSNLNLLHRQRSDLESQLGGKRSRISDFQSRETQISEEKTRLQAQQKDDQAEIKAARKTLEKVLDSMALEENTRQQLDAQRQALLERREKARGAALTARDARHELALKAGSHRASLDSLHQSLERMDNQVIALQQRYLSLSELIAKAKNPEKEFKAEMDALLQKRVAVEARLGAAREGVNKLEEEYRLQDANRQQAMLKLDEIRGLLEHARLLQQEVELTARNLQKRVEELGDDVELIAPTLPESADFDSWSADIERLGVRISRLEPVNLAAIAEYEEESKRKEYMDAQNEDLTKALETLESAIAKIDRKTRTRFKDTFDEVNKGVQELFPRLFGGGHAYLELTGNDLLTTGVSIMARPPGKRVSSIHLLSGGEKALTAVSFVFSIFHLNPAPFCLLDEVDAPLDDANVGRFSALVKEMSETVQFIVVTHNKITMEMVHQLSGVTMREPGVSRLVQVDIEEAARLAAT